MELEIKLVPEANRIEFANVAVKKKGAVEVSMHQIAPNQKISGKLHGAVRSGDENLRIACKHRTRVLILSVLFFQ